MASSSFFLSDDNQERTFGYKSFSLCLTTSQNNRSLFALLFAFLICFAMGFAPESPVQQASICQKYNSPEACLVW